MDRNPLLAGLQMLTQHGTQNTLYDVSGLCVYISHSTNGTLLKLLRFTDYSTPAWNITCQLLGPWSWDTAHEDSVEGPGMPSLWDQYSLLSGFLCALEPIEPIFTKTQLEFPQDENTTMALSAIMQRSPATAEGTCGLMLDPRASNVDNIILFSLRMRPIDTRST